MKIFLVNCIQVNFLRRNNIKQAESLAVRAKKFLNLPTTLVTDINIQNDLFDKIIVVEDNSYTVKKTYRNGKESERLSFKNSSRVLSYDLTPYDETIVLDSDIIICNNQYTKCFEQKTKSILLYKDAFDVCNYRNTREFKYVSNTGCDFYWATCIYFKKDKNSNIFFDLVKHIFDNYNYYKRIYQIASNVYRNDFAFSIAVHIMNNFQKSDSIGIFPGSLYYSIDKDLIQKISDTEILLVAEHEQRQIPIKLNDINLHCMNKFALEKLL